MPVQHPPSTIHHPPSTTARQAHTSPHPIQITPAPSNALCIAHAPHPLAPIPPRRHPPPRRDPEKKTSFCQALLPNNAQGRPTNPSESALRTSKSCIPVKPATPRVRMSNGELRAYLSPPQGSIFLVADLRSTAWTESAWMDSGWGRASAAEVLMTVCGGCMEVAGLGDAIASGAETKRGRWDWLWR